MGDELPVVLTSFGKNDTFENHLHFARTVL